MTHRSLFDGTIQGIRHNQKCALGFQGHPEAGPGPVDADILFDSFVTMMTQHQVNQQQAPSALASESR